jgi:ubiquinone/menaquinone biosynthesis C-methylase UbiE
VDPAVVSGLFDRAAATYDVTAFPFFAPFGEALVEFAQIRPDERVLDVGCGAGAALGPASRAAASAVGVELSPAMAERARVAVPEAEVHVGDASVLAFEDGSFDVVLSSFVVFFLPDPTAALREWGRVLAPGGRLAIATWGAPDERWRSWERPLRGSYVPEIDPAEAEAIGAGLGQIDRFASAEKVESELRGAGFDGIDVIERTIEFVFPDEQAWWDWNWSHGSRVFLEALPASARDRLRAEMREAMEPLHDDSGYPRTYTALLARARLA